MKKWRLIFFFFLNQGTRGSNLERCEEIESEIEVIERLQLSGVHGNK